MFGAVKPSTSGGVNVAAGLRNPIICSAINGRSNVRYIALCEPFRYQMVVSATLNV